MCRRCVEKSTGKEYAVKIISRKVDSSREVALLRLCQSHPNIVQLHQVFHDEVNISLDFCTNVVCFPCIGYSFHA